jgi:Fe-S cluster biosynthesis and repair protein YggX
MTRLVDCAKLGKSLPGLEYAPLKGDMGARIYNEISEEAWGLWVKHQTMVINEYRLNPSEPKAQDILIKQMEDFFFGEGVKVPEEFVPPEQQ